LLEEIDEDTFGALKDYFSDARNALTSLGFSNELHITSVHSVNNVETSAITTTVLVRHLDSIPSGEVTFVLHYYSKKS